MILGGLATPWVLGIFAAAAGLLVALHILRMLALKQRVVTTLFYRQVPLQTQTARLWERFRYPRTFLFLLLIILFICGALAGPRWQDAADTPIVLIVDADYHLQGATGGGGTQPASRLTPWDLACLRTLKTVAGIPRDGVLTVVLADPAPRVILNSNEPHAGLARRLTEVKPASGAASAAYSVQFARDLLQGQPGRVLWLTDHPDEKLAQANGVTVLPVSEPTVLAGSPPQVAMLSAVYEPAPVITDDGQLRVRIGCWGAKDSLPLPLELQASMGSAWLPVESGVTVLPNSVHDIVVSKVPPHGQVLHLSLKRGTTVEDQADWVAPTLNLPRIKIAGEIPEALRLAALAVGTQAGGEEVGAVTFCTSASSAGVVGPAFVVVDQGANQITEPTVVTGVGGGGKLVFDGARCGVGPELGTRGIPLLMAGSQVVAVLDPNLGGAGVRLYLSSALFAAGSEVPRRPAFFSLVSRYVIQFAQARVNPPTLSGPEQTADPLYAQTQQANILLGSRETMGGFREDAASTKPTVPAIRLSGSLQFYEWLLLGAVLLLGVETILYVRGRIV